MSKQKAKEPASDPPRTGKSARREVGTGPRERSKPGDSSSEASDVIQISIADAVESPDTLESKAPASIEREESEYKLLETSQDFGRFQLLIEMAHGGMAVLYLARIKGPEGFEKLVAIKKIHEHLAREKSFIEMFLDEARIAALIQHPNVATIFDLGNVEDAYFIAMEYVHGQSLMDLLRATVRHRFWLPWSFGARMIASAAAGLHAAHELRSPEGRHLNVVHRDVSPQNILISYDGHVKVVDFGVAYAAEKLGHTGAGVLKGKVSYMSPEQTTGTVLDRRSDIFSLGVLLWESVCQKRLFQKESDVDTLLAIRKAEVPPPRSVRGELPKPLEAIISKALAQNPEDRFESAQDMAERLQELLVAEGQVVSDQKVAELMERMFHDRKKFKDAQIQEAMTQKSNRPMKGIGMAGATRTSLEMPRIELDEAPRRSHALLYIMFITIILAAGLAIAAIVIKPGFLPWFPSKGAPSTDGSQVKLVAEKRPDAEAMGAMKSAQVGVDAGSEAKATATLKIRVEPPEARAVVVFGGRRYPGSIFKVLLPRSNKKRTVDIEAEGFEPQKIVVTPMENKDITVKMKPVSAMAVKEPRRRKKQARRQSSRDRVRLLKTLPR